jgi:transcriptional regulator with XRE-family HTH domain
MYHGTHKRTTPSLGGQSEAENEVQMKEKKTTKKAAKNILIISHEKNIRHTELAKAAGISDSMMSQIMHGKKAMPIEHLGAIAKCLGVSESRLLR